MRKKETVIFTNACIILDGKGNVLLQNRVNQSWSGLAFPGGHVEAGESFTDAVVREVFEETAVQIRILSDFRQTVHYCPMPGVRKEVVYFLTETLQEQVKPREGEIAQVEWVPLEQAESSLTHENDKTVLRAAIKKLKKNGFPLQRAGTNG